MTSFGKCKALISVAASIFLLNLAAAAAGPVRPVYACFSPENAMVIGRLGANDLSVRRGFETGQCLALPAGVPLNDVERHGQLWRFRIFGAKPFLFAADWATGFQPPTEPTPAGFEQYLPVTERLIAAGRMFAECYEASEKLSRRVEDHDRRWRDYEGWSNPKPDASSPRAVIYVGNTGPKLAEEAEQLRQQVAALQQRCEAVTTLEADQDFVTFVRTARA